MNSFVQATTSVAAGDAAASVVPARVAALTEGVLKAMVRSKLTTAAAVLAVLVVVAVGVGAVLHQKQAAAAQPELPKAAQSPAPHKGRPQAEPGPLVAR